MDDSTRREFSESLLGASLTTLAAAQAPIRTMRRKDWTPAYLKLDRTGELKQRIRELFSIYKACHLCPRRCGVDRFGKDRGVCNSGARVKVYSTHAHFGEERPLVGRGGSGTIFFSHCNLLCLYCQNWEINHRGDGHFITDERLGALMLGLQEAGCHNVNVVTPTHCVPNIASALRRAIAGGLRIPIVYNCGGYESLEVVKLLDGIVDIYLPDFKYTDGAMAAKYSTGAADYPEAAAAAIQEMHRQVGDLVVDEHGIALRGLMIRHLVLPHNIAGTDRFVRWVAANLSRSTFVNIMPQYRPEHRAREFPELSRRITQEEFGQALLWAREAGLNSVSS